MLSTNALGLFDLLLKFHFLFVLQPTVINNHTGVGLLAHVLYFTAAHHSELCFALTLSHWGMLVAFLLLPSLETVVNICLKIAMLPAFFLVKVFSCFKELQI